MKRTALALILALGSAVAATAGNVIFIHPDGAGIAHWQAARFHWVGPDADLSWDKLPHIAVYRGHLEDSLIASSNGGGTVHAYGVKAPYTGFGSDRNGERPASAGGGRMSLMEEAIERGYPVGIVNSGSLIEPGTAAFLASVKSRSDDSASVITQLVESKANVILGGGEEWFLPEGTAGRHAESGKRTDGRNLIEEARRNGYAIVFDLAELKALPASTDKVLGIFCSGNMFNDKPLKELTEAKLPTYKAGTPTLAEMTEQALRLLNGRGKEFLLVVEEEGSDNFGNHTNALGVLDALKRADEAFAVGIDFVEKNPDTLLITCADSEAGGMDAVRPSRNEAKVEEVFESKPDRAGRTHRFAIAWATASDSSGGIAVRGIGKNAAAISGSFDNTRVYGLMRKTLFSE